VPRLAKHDFSTCCAATGRMRGQILRPHVGLGLDDPPDAEGASIVVHEMHADEVTRDRKRARGVEVARKFAGSCHGPASYAGLSYFGTAVAASAMRTSFFTLFTPSIARISASASFASVGDEATPVNVTLPW
jgi:hypothetical protein